MTVQIAIERRVGETRGVALDADGRPFSLFLDRWSEPDRAVTGRQMDARVRTLERALRGAFVELSNGEEAFLRLTRRWSPTEGQAIRCVVVSERRGEKLARVMALRDNSLDADSDARDALALWRQSLQTGEVEPVDYDGDDTDTIVQEAIDEALAVRLRLPSDGYLHIEPTSALTAIDVDSGGRPVLTNAQRQMLNADAILTAARHIELRGLGGLLVMDCVNPMPNSERAGLKAHLTESFRLFSRRTIDVIAPSHLGLMQVSVPWRSTPIAERLNDPDGQPGVETRALDAIARLEREGEGQRGATLTLSVPRPVLDWLSKPPFDWRKALADRIGHRFSLDATPANKVSVAAS